MRASFWIFLSFNLTDMLEIRKSEFSGNFFCPVANDGWGVDMTHSTAGKHTKKIFFRGIYLNFLLLS